MGSHFYSRSSPANIDLGTACGKYFRVSCLSILDAGKSFPCVIRVMQVDIESSCTWLRCEDKHLEEPYSVWRLRSEGHLCLKNLREPFVCCPHTVTNFQVTPTSSAPKSKRLYICALYCDIKCDDKFCFLSIFFVISLPV